MMVQTWVCADLRLVHMAIGLQMDPDEGIVLRWLDLAVQPDGSDADATVRDRVFTHTRAEVSKALESKMKVSTEMRGRCA